MISLTNGHISERDVLKLRPPRGKLDPMVVKVLAKIKKDRKDTVERVLDLIESQGLTLYMQELRDKLDRSIEGDVTRALLSTPGVLEEIIEPIVTPQAPPKPAAAQSLEPVVMEIRDLSGKINSMPDRFARIMWQILKEYGDPNNEEPYTVPNRDPVTFDPDDSILDNIGEAVGDIVDAITGDGEEAAEKEGKPAGSAKSKSSGGSR